MGVSAVFRAGSTLALVLAGLMTTPAMAYKWPGDKPSIGSALAARAIGRNCHGVLGPAEIAEIDAFLAKAAAEWEAGERRANRRTSFDDEFKRLSATYDDRFRDPRACSDASEEARDTLRKVRQAMATGKPVLPGDADADSPPSPGKVIQAKIVAEKCENAVSAREWAGLELYLARSWIAFAGTATDADTRTFMIALKSAERNIADGWQPKDCTEAAVAKARLVSGLVQKALDRKAR